jgi:putative oxidoreductase
MAQRYSTVGLSETIAAPDARARQGITIVRIIVAATMVIHGCFRLVDGTVSGFGGFLSAHHIPLGTIAAMGITLMEIGGGLTLASGRFVRLLSFYFALQLLAGIVLVHRHQGWFVVGAGYNGMEYSVVLIGALMAIAWADRGRDNHPGRR